MNTREHYELFRYLAGQYCLLEEDITFVESVAGWCREQGIAERDETRPLKLVSKPEPGCRLIIKEDVPDEVVSQRINALSVRGALINTASDRASMLNSDRKRLAYIFLSEYANTVPEAGDSELMRDNWAFAEMERLGFFKS